MSGPGPTGDPTSGPAVHATALLLGTAGVLLRGPSGSGKTMLALHLVAARRAAGRFAALVADDGVILAPAGGRLVARVPAPIAGLAEIRGLGIRPVDAEAAAVLRLVVDLVAVDQVPRMPEEAETRVTIAGVTLRRLAVPTGDRHRAALVVEAALAAEDAATAPQRKPPDPCECLLRSPSRW